MTSQQQSSWQFSSKKKKKYWKWDNTCTKFQKKVKPKEGQVFKSYLIFLCSMDLFFYGDLIEKQKTQNNTYCLLDFFVMFLCSGLCCVSSPPQQYQLRASQLTHRLNMGLLCQFPQRKEDSREKLSEPSEGLFFFWYFFLASDLERMRGHKRSCLFWFQLPNKVLLWLRSKSCDSQCVYIGICSSKTWINMVETKKHE